MTRKEEICDVTKEQFTYVKDENLKSALRFAFIDGAQWADEHPNLESLWHDPDEEPQEYPILCLNKQKDIWIECDLDPYDDGWDECVEFNELVRWAYVQDLFPKGGEK